jgi:hypothetical protein
MIEVVDDVFPVALGTRVKKWLLDPAMEDYATILTHDIARLELQATALVADMVSRGNDKIGHEAETFLKRAHFLKEVKVLLRAHSVQQDEFTKIKIAVNE